MEIPGSHVNAVPDWNLDGEVLRECTRVNTLSLLHTESANQESNLADVVLSQVRNVSFSSLHTESGQGGKRASTRIQNLKSTDPDRKAGNEISLCAFHTNKLPH